MKQFASFVTLGLVLSSQMLSVDAQGGGGGGGGSSTTTSGESTGTGCSPSSGVCATAGTSNYVSLSLSYSNSTGKFSGSITTNLCMNHAYGLTNGTFLLTSSNLHSASCITQTIPAPAYTSTPIATPTRGRVGLSISGGVNIYGPMDDGFTTGQVCTSGSCPSGSDLGVCQKKLLKECSSVSWNYLPDDCGGHANAYHYHGKLACDYNTTLSTTHSSLVGVALDGRGIYGKYEGASGLPTDLDACNGHYGSVPAYNDSKGNYFAAATNVYHYHITDAAPFTLGCFGPVSSLSACKSLYSTCGTGYSCFNTTSGPINYDTDCPCFQQNGTTYNQDYTSTCLAGATTTTTSPTAAPTSSKSALRAWLSSVPVLALLVLAFMM
eukprot:TRINITY_DN10092_c0_g1_i1.p1 TRINITY_DN10092_c0_g1~~TRINITY_DN10092_c0_g1_i1.p1  ORF type:complete len:380 (-),score=69.68 TRINITY_DN10092_c0_g1_i1:42-1181(-)